jgi:hypothetical protein
MLEFFQSLKPLEEEEDHMAATYIHTTLKLFQVTKSKDFLSEPPPQKMDLMREGAKESERRDCIPALLQMSQAQGPENSERDEGNSILEERVGPSQPLKIAAEASIAAAGHLCSSFTSTTDSSTHTT